VEFTGTVDRVDYGDRVGWYIFTPPVSSPGRNPVSGRNGFDSTYVNMGGVAAYHTHPQGTGIDDVDIAATKAHMENFRSNYKFIYYHVVITGDTINDVDGVKMTLIPGKKQIRQERFDLSTQLKKIRESRQKKHTKAK
jgi:hypothetical protein